MKEVTQTHLDIQNPQDLLATLNSYASYRRRNEVWKTLPENENMERNMTYKEYFEENAQNSSE